MTVAFQLPLSYVVCVVALLQKQSFAADFTSCLASANHYRAMTGACYDMVYADGARIKYEDAIPLCRPGGHPAFLVGDDVRNATSQMAIAAGWDAHIGLIQNADQNDTQAGWHWVHPDGREWPAFLELMNWGWPGPSSVNGSNVILNATGFLNDANGRSDGVICQYAPTQRHFKAILTGERPTYPIAVTLTNVDSVLKCVSKCHKTPICVGIGYSTATGECILTQLPPDAAETTTSTDEDFIFFASRPN